MGCSTQVEAQTMVAPSSTSTPAPLVANPTPIVVVATTPAPIIDESFTGYWLKLSKPANQYNEQTLQLLYQSGQKVTVVSEFCVRDGKTKTPIGFYFLAVDKAARYSTAPKGYADTIFPHNFIYKFQKDSNFYVHPAPWNTTGEKGCPAIAGGGCINMRWGDFDVLHDGGTHTNPLTNETTTIPAIKVGTPFVIVENGASCSTLEECLRFYDSSSFHEAFVKYTCARCENAEAEWQKMNLTIASEAAQ